jgi:hypothetical protein
MRQREFFRLDAVQALETLTHLCGAPPHYCRPELYAQTHAAQAAQGAKAAAEQRAREAQEREAIIETRRFEAQWKQLGVLGKITALHNDDMAVTNTDKFLVAAGLMSLLGVLAFWLAWGLGIIR